MSRRLELQRRSNALPDEVTEWVDRSLQQVDYNGHYSQMQAIRLMIDVFHVQQQELKNLDSSTEPAEFQRTIYLLIEKIIKAQSIWDFFRDKLELPAHPAWITPILFTRSMNGVIFDVEFSLPEVSPEEQTLVDQLSGEIRALLKVVDITTQRLSVTPDEGKPLVRLFLDDTLETLKQTELKKSQILGDSVRILGEKTQKNVDIELSVRLRVRSLKYVDDIQFNVQYPANALLNSDVKAGKDTLTILPAVEILPAIEDGQNNRRIRLLWPRGTPRQFNPGEYEIAKLIFHVAPSAPSGWMDLHISKVGIYYNTEELGKGAMSGFLFIEE